MFKEVMRILIFSLFIPLILSSCGGKKESRKPASPRLEKHVYVDRAPSEASSMEVRVPGEEKGEITEQVVLLDLVNDHREKMGLGRLAYSEVVELTAQNHSIRMSKRYFPFGHMGSTLRCRSILKALGLELGSLCGENVAMGQESPEEAFEAWMNSPEHREAIEDGRYTHTGLGIFENARGTIYWTQIFIRIN